MPANRTSQYAESLASSNTTGTAYTSKVSLSFTPEDNSTYMFFWSGQIQNTSNLTADAKARLQRTTGTATTLGEQLYEMKDTTDWFQFGGMDYETYGTSPGSQTFQIQFAAQTSGNSINIRNARILAIKLEANDQKATSAASSTTTSGTYQTKTTLTFTPPSDGDYLIIASAEVRNQTNGDDIGVRLWDGTTAYGATDVTSGGMPTKDTRNYYGWTTIEKATLTATSKTFTIDFRNTPGAGDTVEIRSASIVAIRLDDLHNNHYAESRTRAESTSATFQDRVTLTQTMLAQDYAVLMVGLYDDNSTTVSSRMRGLEGATDLGEAFTEGNTSNPTPPVLSYMVAYKKTFTAGSVTFKTQTASETTSAITGHKEGAIILLQLTGSTASTGSSSLTFSPSAQGRSQALSTASSSLTFSPTAQGRSLSIASATITLTFTPTGTGIAAFRATGASTLTFAPTAQGRSLFRGSGSSTLTFTPTAQGLARTLVSGASTLSFTPTAQGRSTALSTASSTLAFSPTAQGRALSIANASSSLTFAPTAQGRSLFTGIGASFITFTPTGQGLQSGSYTGTSSLTFAASAQGLSRALGNASSTLTFAPTGQGRARALATANSSLTFTPTAQGKALSLAVGASTLTFTPAAQGLARALATGTLTFTFSVSGQGQQAGQHSGASSLTFAVLGQGKALARGTASSSLLFTSNAQGRSLYTSQGSGNLTFTPLALGWALAQGIGSSALVFGSVAQGRSLAIANASSTLSFTALGIAQSPFAVLQVFSMTRPSWEVSQALRAALAVGQLVRVGFKITYTVRDMETNTKTRPSIEVENDIQLQ